MMHIDDGIEERIRLALEYRADRLPETRLLSGAVPTRRPADNRPRLVALAAAAAAVAGVVVVVAALALDSGSSSPKVATDPPSTIQPGSELPDRVGILDAAGNLVGYADPATKETRADSVARFGGDVKAGTAAWLREPIPVTTTEDPLSQVVGYYFRTLGFVDLATYRSPTFNLDKRLAESDTTASTDRDAGTALVVVATRTLKFDRNEYTAPAGRLPIAYTGALDHRLASDAPAFAGIELHIDADGPDTAIVDVQPGTYTIFCTVPGHREAGMKATLVVTDGTS